MSGLFNTNVRAGQGEFWKWVNRLLSSGC